MKMLTCHKKQNKACIQPIPGQCSHFIPPENTRKPFCFWCFQEGIKWEHWPEICSQPLFDCSKLTIETLEQGVKYVQN